MNKQKGFTLIELLVVIAIIGILAAIAMVNLNSARLKARVAAAKGSITAVQAGAVLCLDTNANLTSTGQTACGGSGTPVAAMKICDSTTSSNAIGNWPTFPSGGSWQYNNTCNSSIANSTFSYQAFGDSCIITCNEAACTFSSGC